MALWAVLAATLILCGTYLFFALASFGYQDDECDCPELQAAIEAMPWASETDISFDRSQDILTVSVGFIPQLDASTLYAAIIEQVDQTFDIRRIRTDGDVTVTAFNTTLASGTGDLIIELYDGEPSRISTQFALEAGDDAVTIFEELVTPIKRFLPVP